MFNENDRNTWGVGDLDDQATVAHKTCVYEIFAGHNGGQYWTS